MKKVIYCGSIDYDMYSIRRVGYNCTGLFKAGGDDAKHTRYILTADTCIYIYDAASASLRRRVELYSGGGWNYTEEESPNLYITLIIGKI